MKNLKNMLMAMVFSMAFMGLPTSAYADPIATLTLEQAIKSAQFHSISLSQLERETVLNSEKLSQAYGGDDFFYYQQQYVAKQITQKELVVQKEVIAYNISKLFDEIGVNERKLQDMETSLNLLETDLKNLEQKQKLGYISIQSLEDARTGYDNETYKTSQVKQTIQNQYYSLCNQMGRSYTPFNLEKNPLTYEPYETITNLEGFLSSQADQHLSVWKSQQNATLNQTINWETLNKAGGDYLVVCK